MGAHPRSYTLTKAGPFRLYSIGELYRLPPPRWLVKPVLPEGGLIGLIGQPEVGKTFVALDMALSVATGRVWQGCRVKQGYVVYISAEGGAGIGRRVHAWCIDRSAGAKEPRIAFMLESMPVAPDSDGLTKLLERISELNEEPDLVVIDTLARCFIGDENKQEDMNAFVAGVDLLRQSLHCAVLAVHHPRLDGDRERGSTTFRGAADTMIFAKREGATTNLYLSCEKQKDGAHFKPFKLKLNEIDLGELDEDGEPVTSCVIAGETHADNVQVSRVLLSVLKENGPLGWDEWLAQVSGFNISKSSFYRTKLKLEENGQILKENGRYAISGFRGFQGVKPELSQ